MPDRPRSTMVNVAKLAGVSLATVSKVVNGNAPVGAARLKRVQEAMAVLDYQPDDVARSLRTGRTKVVGMVVPDITNPFFPLWFVRPNRRRMRPGTRSSCATRMKTPNVNNIT